MKKVFFLIFLLTPFLLLADGNEKLLKIYRSKAAGKVDYLVISLDKLQYVQWQEAEERLVIAFDGGYEHIKTKSEDEANKIIRDIYNMKQLNWISVENEASLLEKTKKKKQSSGFGATQVPF